MSHGKFAFAHTCDGAACSAGGDFAAWRVRRYSFEVHHFMTSRHSLHSGLSWPEGPARASALWREWFEVFPSSTPDNSTIIWAIVSVLVGFGYVTIWPKTFCRKYNQKKHMRAEIAGVAAQPRQILPSIAHFMPAKPFSMPMPTMAPTTACELDTGTRGIVGSP